MNAILIWTPVLLVAAWLAHWGAEHLSDILGKLRRRWGLSATAGGAVIGLAAASPEVTMNTTSVIKGLSGIGLGVMFSSNVLAIPILVSVVYFATRKSSLSGHPDHRQHIEQSFFELDSAAVWVQALPYTALVVLAALLILPSPWRGLDPVDGWIMLAAYGIYLTQALLRGRDKSERVKWDRKKIILAAFGAVALGAGAFGAVVATEKIASAAGISQVVSGLFITAPAAILPELFATWSAARRGEVTAAGTSFFGDHAVTLSVGFFPLAMVSVPVDNFRLLWINVLFVGLVPILYSIFNHFGSNTHGFYRWQCIAFLLLPLLWIGIVWRYAL